VNILNRKVYASIITLIIILGIIYFIATTTNLYPINRASIDVYEGESQYGIVMMYSKHGILPVVLKDAFIVNRSGDVLNPDHLDFEWTLWHTTKDDQGVFMIENDAKHNEFWQSFANYKTRTKDIKLILEIKTERTFSKTDDLYLELHYEVWGIKKVVKRLI